MSQAFKEYADGNNSDQIFSTFKINLNIERQAIQTDHKQYGATRFFGRFQHASRLLTLVDQAHSTAFSNSA